MSATPTTERGAHPCFDRGHAENHARLHLPVAPRCNIQCRYCDRSFDCVNESRPGVSATILGPEEALERVNQLRFKLPGLSVIGIAGPGDPLANPRETFATFRLVRAAHPDLALCLSTNGLALPEHIREIADIGISHLTVTMNAIRPEVSRLIYSWIRFDGRARTGEEASNILLERQKEGIALAVAKGLTIKLNTILVPGVNDSEVEPIAALGQKLGVHFMNIIPLLPVAGTPLGFVGEPAKETVAAARAKAEKHLPQLAHCKRCRADAAGLLGKDLPIEELSPPADALAYGQPPERRGCGGSCSKGGCSPAGCGATDESSRPEPVTHHRAITVAVGSREGILVNRHLGEADRLFIFRVEPDGSYGTVDIRALPSEGSGADRWNEVAATVSDCEAVIVSGIGAPPRRVLEAQGLTVHVVEGLISEALSAVAQGKDLSFMGKRAAGAGCGCSGGNRACC